MLAILELHLVCVVSLYLVWFMVCFMVVMVIPPWSSSKQAWPALGGSAKEQSKNLPIRELYGDREISTDSQIHKWRTPDQK